MSVNEEVYAAVKDLLDKAALEEEQILVVGCSTSEVLGERIGTASNLDVAEAIYNGIQQALEEEGVTIFLAVQCCEHLNRAIVVERQCAKKYGLEAVNVRPWIGAGGAFATHCYQEFTDPVMVEFISGHAGIDIGDTLIGMHVKHVATPVRTKQRSVGQAHVTAARYRPKLIGGERARYSKNSRRCSF